MIKPTSIQAGGWLSTECGDTDSGFSHLHTSVNSWVAPEALDVALDTFSVPAVLELVMLLILFPTLYKSKKYYADNKPKQSS